MGVAGLIFEPHPPNFENLYKYIQDVQMMLKHFFDISTGFRYKKNGKEFSVHVQRRPWINILFSKTIPKWRMTYDLKSADTIQLLL